MHPLAALALVTAAALTPVAAPAHATGPAAGSGSCNAMAATIVGTEGPDRLRGTSGPDVIAGLGGADRIEGLGGVDVICGGEGNDRVHGGTASDHLLGDAGDDRLHGGTQGPRSDEILDGGDGDDHLVPGRDTSSGHGIDQIQWSGATQGLVVDLRAGTASGQGDDTLAVAAGLRVVLTDFDDELVGSRWRDEVRPGHGHDRVETGAGSDTVTFARGQDPSADPSDLVRLGVGSDTLRHFDGDLTAYAGEGADLVVERGPGSDRVHAGAGSDRVHTQLSDAAGQEVSGDRGDDTLVVVDDSVPGLDWDMASGEAVAGEPGTEVLLAAFEAGVLDQDGGTNTVAGTPDWDVIDARTATSFSARGGKDHFVGSEGSDSFHGGGGRDTYEDDRGGAPNTCTSVEADLTGACGAPRAATVSRTSARATAECRGERATIVGTDGRDRLLGTPRRDVIAGLGGNDWIEGSDGDDLVCGGRGSDQLAGGAGDDRLFGGPDLVEEGETQYHRGDTLTGGLGDDLLDGGFDERADRDGVAGDSVSWADSARPVHVDLGAGRATGQGRDRVRLVDGHVHLTFHDDTFVGGPGSESVHAMDGQDDVRTGGGDDVVWLDDVEEVSDDVARTGPGRDTVWSLGGRDDVRTQGGRDSLHLVGDQLQLDASAGGGADVVEALVRVGAGHRATGGPGRDLLRLEVQSDEPADHSLDLASGVLLLGAQQLAAVAGGFEDAELYRGRFTVRGTAGPNRVLVDLAATFHGLGGDDGFGGSSEDDTFDGGPGEDSYLADGGGSNACRDVERDPQGACSGT